MKNLILPLMLVASSLCCGGELFASAAAPGASPATAANSAPSSQDPARAVLEAEYSQKFQSKVEAENQRVSESVDVVMYGSIAVMLGLGGLCLFVLMRLKQQQQMLNELQAQISNQSSQR